MKSEKLKFIKAKDRNLGDEWTEWTGTFTGATQNADTGKRIFMAVLLLAIFVFGVFGFFVWYMIAPRLLQFNPLLPSLIGLLFFAIWLFFALWFLIMVASVWMEKDFFMILGRKEISLTFLVPLVLKFGARIGISRDRLSNSFVKISNTLIRSTARKVSPDKLLILLPRCLKKTLISTIVDLSKQWRIPVHIVAGGTKARQIISAHNPKAIIGVACERDLLSGIQDVIKNIPVIGIPNLRPKGPCKDTEIDLRELERALQTFLGKEIKISKIE